MPVPRFVSPIATTKIRRAPPPPSIYELLEQVTTRAPEEMTETALDVATEGPLGAIPLASIAPPTGNLVVPSVMESLEVAGIPSSPSAIEAPPVAPTAEPVAIKTKATRKRGPTIRKVPKTPLELIAEATGPASGPIVADADLEAAAAETDVVEEPVGELPKTH